MQLIATPVAVICEKIRLVRQKNSFLSQMNPNRLQLPGRIALNYLTKIELSSILHSKCNLDDRICHEIGRAHV